jgi:carboxypeptidase family protein
LCAASASTPGAQSRISFPEPTKQGLEFRESIFGISLSMTMRLILCALLLVCFAVSSPILLLAQSGDIGSLEGIVTDPAGEAVPGVSLRATDRQHGASFTTVTDSEGLFRFSVVLTQQQATIFVNQAYGLAGRGVKTFLTLRIVEPAPQNLEGGS